jgi:8-oxo-dGTP diphosphatase
MNQTHQHVVAIHGLIKNSDKYLVTHRSLTEDYQPGRWDIPGGGFEDEEYNPCIVLNREVSEEVGLTVKIGKIIHLFSEIQTPTRHQFQAIYECEYQGGEVKLDLNEHDEYRWLTPKEMLDLPLMNFVKSLVEEVLLKQVVK